MVKNARKVLETKQKENRYKKKLQVYKELSPLSVNCKSFAATNLIDLINIINCTDFNSESIPNPALNYGQKDDVHSSQQELQHYYCHQNNRTP